MGYRWRVCLFVFSCCKLLLFNFATKPFDVTRNAKRPRHKHPIETAIHSSWNVFLFSHVTALRFQLHLNVLQCWSFKLLDLKYAFEQWCARFCFSNDWTWILLQNLCTSNLSCSMCLLDLQCSKLNLNTYVDCVCLYLFAAVVVCACVLCCVCDSINKKT
jgi:hypothetical protein